jgi:putative tricarboxylic transport membrane protein
MTDGCLFAATRREVVAGLAAAGLTPRAAIAQAWAPHRNVEFIVPAAAGSTMDLLARLIAEIWQKRAIVTTPVAVIAKGGGGGALAWSYVSRKTRDGHYLAISGPTLLANDIRKVGDVSYRDVTPIAKLFTEYTCFVVNAASPLKTAGDLVNALKSSRPPSVAVAPGLGSSSHIALLKLARAAAIDSNQLTIIPFKGANESVTAVVGNHIDVTSGTIAVVLPMIESGNLRPIAVTAPQRLTGTLAAVPIWREAGLDVVEGNWRGVVGPKDLGQSEVTYWGEKLARAVETAEWAEALRRNDWNADFGVGSEARRFLDAQYIDMAATLAGVERNK